MGGVAAGGKGLDTGKRFDPAKYLRTIKVRGRGEQTYLPVAARLLWLRADHPQAQVVTEALRLDEKGAVFKATVTLPEGGIAVGHGSETAGDFGDFIEKAETKAIGRALAALGYGTEFAEVQDDPTLAAATEVQPAVPPRGSEPIALPARTPAPAPSAPAAPQPATSVPLRPERLARQHAPVETPERQERPERTASTERITPTERTAPADRFAAPTRSVPTERPIRPERLARQQEPADRAASAEPSEEPPVRAATAERTLRPERLSRTRAATTPAPTEPPAEAAEPPAPTPLRRSGRTLAAGRTFTAPTAAAPAATAAPEPARIAPRDLEEPLPPAEDEDDDLDLATISTTSFWRWARGKGYADRRAVEAATGKSMDSMTPREAYYRLREVLAREGNA
jgi:hypothetical protein